jgi:DNA-directed RNA polymerase specialized sigma24 family protein
MRGSLWYSQSPEPKHLLDSGCMTEQEKTLIAGCLKGEETAWNDFVRQYSGLIYHRIKTTLSSHYHGPSQHLIDDIFQDTFLSLVKDDFAQLRRFRGDHNCTLASWLRMIATRRTIDHLANRCGTASISKFHFCLSTLLLGHLFL